MKARCPNDPEHKRFVTVAHVTQEWIVDEHGEYLSRFEGGESETVHGPDPGNTWQCVECGAEAKVEP
jgi:hypothetical protein